MASTVLSLRGVEAYLTARLVTVHPNPGPGRTRRGRRGGGEEKRRRRRERRGVWRGERREARRRREQREGEGGKGREVVTWNAQGVSMSENNRARLRRMAGRVRREGWEMVCVTEVRAEGDGVVWLGEDEERVVVVHSSRAGVMLRGGALERWVEGGQRKWFGGRVVAVVVGDLRLVSAYQPVWGTDDEGMEEYRRGLGDQIAMGGRERLVIGADFNANVGRGNAREGVCGKYGVGRMNEAGRDLIEWCEENELVYVNSYMKHARRGTWFNLRYGRWYELDGFVVRKRDRHQMVERMRTKSDWSLSDHRPKVMRIRVSERRWRVQGGREGRVPRIRWELLAEEEKKREYAERTRELLDEVEEGAVEEPWGRVSGVMMRAAREVCGVVRREVASPWVVGHEEFLRERTERVTDAVSRRNDCMERLSARRRLRVRRNDGRMIELEREMTEARDAVRVARREVKRYMRRIERRWWDERIGECREASESGRIGDMYKCLRKLGTRGSKAVRGCMITAQEFKEHFERVSSERYEEEPGVIQGVIGRVGDLRGNDRAREANERLNEMPESEEIMRAMKEMKESAPGEDGVRVGYILKACREVKEVVIEIVRWMFEVRADRWEAKVKTGVIVPLFKKGDRNERNNYRGVCLLSMSSRVLARVLARRLAWWAEWVGLLDENQAGFRKGRSTADVVQMMVRIQEDVSDWMRRMNASEEEGVIEERERPVARLLDLRKAYPRVNKPALWLLLERYGMKGRCLDTVKDLHESTEYMVRGREGMSERWMPERGLREGCSTSPILFNVYHQAVMRQAEMERAVHGGAVGVAWRWMPGGSFAGVKAWERGSAEAVSVRLTLGLFADDTTVVGMSGEIEEGVRVTKEVMGRWEERNNDEKEEVLEFGTEEGGKVRVLGSWLGAEEDVRNRMKRAGSLWWKVRSWLKGSKMSKRSQARVVEACVESSLLYDCQARMWYKRDVDRLQKWMDKCYRYVWSDRNGQPLRQMAARGVNMWDVRSMLRVRSVRWKIEKRVLERIGHVVRMGNERLTKAAVFGWYEGLQGTEKMGGRKRKTVLYWKRLLRESGTDWTDVERICSDREEWKKRVRARMERLDVWERQRGHRYEWEEGEERVERNVGGELDLVCRYEGCGKVCKSKGGLTVHQKRMHRAAPERMRFRCRCGVEVETEGALVNHERSCGGGRVEGNRRECGGCGRWVQAGNYARHVRVCGGGGGGAMAVPGGRCRVGPCQLCGRVVTLTNMARHQRSCRVWDPGGGPNP